MVKESKGIDVQESVIRLMTRLAVQHKAVNLAQGFTDEAAAYEMVWGGITAMLGGTDDYVERFEHLTLKQVFEELGSRLDDFFDMRLKDLLASLHNPRDRFNQYSFPFGLPELREAIADYTEHFSRIRPDPETEVTVVLGATEGVSSVLRAICRPDDGLLILQPFHEMYPSQAQVFGLRPEYITLRERPGRGTWELDRDEIEEAVRRNVKVLILNTPHNPTGKVFTKDELSFIAGLCIEHNLIAITDEIYEHILYDDHEHHCLATFDGMRDRTIVVNSISKTGNATGWRVGWVISPVAYTAAIRGVHDTLVIQAPTPLQKGAERLLRLGDTFYRGIRERYAKKRETLMDGLRSIGFQVTPPEGSYYLFVDYRQVPALRDLSPMAAAMFLIEKVGVASVPGDNFYRVGYDGDRYLRFAFCRSLETLREAVQRLSRLLTMQLENGS